jgi:hypothetical protein
MAVNIFIVQAHDGRAFALNSYFNIYFSFSSSANTLIQGAPTEVESSVQLTSSLFCKKENIVTILKATFVN